MASSRPSAGSSPPSTATAGWTSSLSFSAVLGFTLHRALAYANQRDHEHATVEHLLTCRSITGQNVFVDCGQRFLPRDGDVMFEGRERPNG